MPVLALVAFVHQAIAQGPMPPGAIGRGAGGNYMNAYAAPIAAPNIAAPSSGGQRLANSINQWKSSSAYNIKAGPVQMSFSAGMSAQYNSNVTISQSEPTPDLVLTPRLGMGLYWPITRLNNASLNVQLGYNYYMNRPNLGGQTLLVSPATELMFNVFIKDVRITLFTRPSVTDNPVNDPTISDAVNYTMFNNIAGINATWDLNDVLLGFGYSNQFRYAINNTYSNQNNVVNQVYGNASFLVQPYLRLGLEGSVSATTYFAQAADGVASNYGSPGTSNLNDSLNTTLGLFAMGNITRNTEWSAGVGWQVAAFSESNNPLNTGNASNPYFYLNISNELNRFFSHSLGANFESAPSSVSNFVQTFNLGYSFNWIFINNWSLNGGAFFQSGSDSPGPQSEDFNRLGANIGLGYQVMKNLFASINYNYIGKASTFIGDGYTQQIFGLNLTYTF